MTAFEICRARPQLELAPVLRIVKYLGLDGNNLGAEDVARIERLHPHFRKDPELIVGAEDIASRTGLDADAVRRILHERRREIPFLGTAARPMVPEVALAMLRDAADTTPLPRVDAAPGHGDAGMRSANGAGHGGGGGEARGGADVLHRRLGKLEAELADALEQVRGLSRTLSRICTEVGGNGPTRPRPRHRRSGGGKPDTIVEACRKVLAAASEPMKVADITERVLSQGVEINAKSPNVTVSSILSSYEAFQRVRRGYYTLAGAYLAE